MTILEEIQQIAKNVPADLSEKKGTYTFSFVVAERKAFLTKKELEYIAKFRIDDETKELKFTEMLKEAGSGFSAGSSDDDISPGFGFKTETYNTTKGPREGTIEEQSDLFGKQYSYGFDFKTIRTQIENKAKEAGYNFKYQITPIGL